MESEECFIDLEMISNVNILRERRKKDVFMTQSRWVFKSKILRREKFLTEVNNREEEKQVFVDRKW